MLRLSDIRRLRPGKKIRNLLWMLTLAACDALSLRGATYYFSTSGSDTAGDGSQEHPWYAPWAHPAALLTSGDAGNTLCLRRGDVWHQGTRVWKIGSAEASVGGSAAAPIVIRDWWNGPGPLPPAPVISHTLALATEWENTGGHTWAHVAPDAPVPDLFFDGKRLRTRPGATPSSLTDTEWTSDGRKIYVSSADDPARHLVEANVEGERHARFTDGWQPTAVVHVWKHRLPDFPVGDCFIDGGLMGKTSKIANLKTRGQWAYEPETDAHHLYIWSERDPGASLLDVTEFGYALSLTNVSHLTFQNLEFQGGRWTCVGVTQPSSFVTFDACRIVRPGSWGITFINVALLPDASRHHHPVVRNCTFDGEWEPWLNGEITADQNGITLEGSDEGYVGANALHAWGHTAIALEGSNRCIVEMNTTTPGSTNYARALEVIAGPVVISDDYASRFNVVRRNRFIQQRHVASKLWGQNNYYYSNIWSGARLAGVAHNIEGEECDLLTTGETVRDNFIVNNTFDDTGTDSFLVNLYTRLPAPGGMVLGNTFANNLFTGWGKQAGDKSYYGFEVTRANHPGHGADQRVRSNDFWNGNSSAFVLRDLMGPAGANDYRYTAAQANESIPGYSGNRQVDPGYISATGGNYELGRGSAVAAGGADMRGEIRDGVDFDGLPWAASPSLGAYQYTTDIVLQTVHGQPVPDVPAGWYGMKFTVGAHRITVAKLGRYVSGTMPPGTRKHRLKLVDAATGRDVPGGSAVVDLAGHPAGEYAFAPLARLVALEAGKSYYLASEESGESERDLWHDYTTTLAVVPDVRIDAAVSNMAGSWVQAGSSGHCYGPVSLRLFDSPPDAALSGECSPQLQDHAVIFPKDSHYIIAKKPEAMPEGPN